MKDKSDPHTLYGWDRTLDRWLVIGYGCANCKQTFAKVETMISHRLKCIKKRRRT